MLSRPFDGISKGLRRRFLSSFVLAPLVLGALVLGMPWSILLLAIMIALLAWEWTGLIFGRFHPAAVALLFLGPLAAVYLAVTAHWLWALAAVAASGLVAAGAISLLDRDRSGKGRWLFVGCLYIGIPSLALLWLREDYGDGLSWTLWLLAVVWSFDICAYAVGRRIGGPKLWPRLSPQKTWAGLLGGLFFCSIMGLLGSLWIASEPAWVLAFGAAGLGLVAQAGDLAESAMKRHFGVKDASALIPGHGGLMDRVDGLLPASIVLAAALWLAQ